MRLSKQCKYLVRFPSLVSGTEDYIRLNIHTLDKADVSIFYGTTYSADTLTSITGVTDVDLDFAFPNQVFIVFSGNNIFRGNFSFSASYISYGGYTSSNISYVLNNTGFDINANYEEYFAVINIA